LRFGSCYRSWCDAKRLVRLQRVLAKVAPPGGRVRNRDLRDGRERILSNYVLRLYVTGKTARAEQAIANLRRICEDDLRGRYELEIIDVLQKPQLAEDEKILATPTLIKRLPPPLRRVIGDLSNKERVLLGLDVWPDSATGGEATP
jgi:circadian clock protein KaiB